MFPVSVCLRIESKRFVEEETQRKRLGSPAGRIRVPDLPFSGGATKMVALLPMNERYLRWYSPWLSREFELLAFGNGGGLPLIIFPTSFGRYYQNKDFGVVGSVSAFVDAGRVTVYCPDAIDLESFYDKSIHPADRMRTHNAYENLIDVFDFARREYGCHRVAVCGASLGAYHAANIAFRHPDAVSLLISLSGSFDIGHDWNYWRDMLPYYLSVL